MKKAKHGVVIIVPVLLMARLIGPADAQKVTTPVGKLKDLIEIEQSRSAKLIEVTKGLWDIIELMDDGKPGPAYLAAALTKDVAALTNLEVEVSDESISAITKSSNFPQIEEMAPLMATV